MLQKGYLLAKSAPIRPRTNPAKFAVWLGIASLIWDCFCPCHNTTGRTLKVEQLLAATSMLNASLRLHAERKAALQKDHNKVRLPPELFFTWKLAHGSHFLNRRMDSSRDNLGGVCGMHKTLKQITHIAEQIIWCNGLLLCSNVLPSRFGTLWAVSQSSSRGDQTGFWLESVSTFGTRWPSHLT